MICSCNGPSILAVACDCVLSPQITHLHRMISKIFSPLVNRYHKQVSSHSAAPSANHFACSAQRDLVSPSPPLHHQILRQSARGELIFCNALLRDHPDQSFLRNLLKWLEIDSVQKTPLFLKQDRFIAQDRQHLVLQLQFQASLRRCTCSWWSHTATDLVTDGIVWHRQGYV